MDYALWWLGVAVMTSCCLLFLMNWRLAPLLVVGYFAYALMIDSSNNLAKNAGFLSEDDRRAAARAGITDPTAWIPIRLQREVEAQRAQRKLDAVAAKRLGFDGVEDYHSARKIGLGTGRAYRAHLREQSFMVQPPPQKYVVADVVRARKASGAEADRRAARKLALCRTLDDRDIENWTGWLKSFTTSFKGRGVLEIDIGESVTITTHGNGLTDGSKKTLINPQSALYKHLATALVGERVLFSGRFFDSDVDCIEELSITATGSLFQPEYAFRFTKVEVLSNVERRQLREIQRQGALR